MDLGAGVEKGVEVIKIFVKCLKIVYFDKDELFSFFFRYKF